MQVPRRRGQPAREDRTHPRRAEAGPASAVEQRAAHCQRYGGAHLSASRDRPPCLRLHYRSLRRTTVASLRAEACLYRMAGYLYLPLLVQALGSSPASWTKLQPVLARSMLGRLCRCQGLCRPNTQGPRSSARRGFAWATRRSIAHPIPIPLVLPLFGSRSIRARSRFQAFRQHSAIRARENALRWLEDARTLFERGSVDHAFVAAMFGLEEASGAVPICGGNTIQC